MRFPWSKAPTGERLEKRDAGGGYTDAVVAAIEARAAQQVADVSSTAAIESVAGLLSSSPSEKHGWRVFGGMMGPVQ